jgi:hypothetical protein
MGRDSFRQEIQELQSEYSHDNSLTYLNYISNKEMIKCDRVYDWNRGDNLLIRARKRAESQDAVANREEDELDIAMRAA